MKKRICLWLCLMMAAVSILAGCGGSDGNSSAAPSEEHTQQSGGVEDVLAAGMQEQDEAEVPASEEAAPVEPTGEEAPAEPSEEEPANEEATPEVSTAEEPEEDVPADLATDVDVDLTVLSSTMVYSEVYNMMKHPSDYIGKSIRMRGEYTYMHDDASGNDYFACIIKDATACCAQGIEFVLTDDYVYPDDYPQMGDEITVTGVFDVYMEGVSKYCTLRGAELE